MKGTVTKSTGSWYLVKTDQGVFDARIRGKFRNKNIKTTNPVAVGDEVLLDFKEGDAVIYEIEERKNYIIRKSTNLSKKTQIIAANVDRAYLMITVKYPQTLAGFVDRFLVSAEAYNIPVTILINKIDLYDEEDMDQMEAWRSIYEPLGYPCYAITASQPTEIAFIKEEIKHHQVILSGNSGVGKSTLLNSLDPSLNLSVQELSEYHQSGQHTTTFAEMHPVASGGYIIDTPGLRGFGIVDMEQTEVSHYFPEMLEYLPDCKFNDCLHINEPGCAVQKAASEGKIALSRYENYMMMLDEQQDESYRKDIYGSE